MFGRWKSHIYHVGLPTYCEVCCFSHHGPNLCTKPTLVTIIVTYTTSNHFVVENATITSF